MLFIIINSKFTLKPVIILLFIISSLLNYFMLTYNVIIDHEMIRNSLQTDANETMDLLNIKLFCYLFFLGILPSIFIFKMKIKYHLWKQEILFKIKYIVLFTALIFLMVFSFSKFYTSFFRENKILRYHTNPTFFLYSLGKYVSKTFEVNPTLTPIGEDAKSRNTEKKKLVIVVVGEALRADRFSLNGYEKETNAYLKQYDIINLSEVYSCGTSTAHSVPCMFSSYAREDYSYKKGLYTQNALDVLMHTGDIDVLWRDNNSDSKGVALRVAYEDFKLSKNNSLCEGECRDEGMLIGLDEFIAKSTKENFLIVLHQMGNHGPAYYKRYPKSFEKFTPTCKTNQVENCSIEEISNAYDNAVLYSDYFLAKSIDYLKSKQGEFETALIYMSDHGESLGENGIYLHGMPYFIAPKVQKHIAAFVWLGSEQIKKRVDIERLKKISDKVLSHDNLFHSILGIMDVESKVYDKTQDIFSKDFH